MAVLRPQMMQNLLLQEGDLVVIRSANLPKGSFVKLQPHTKDFLDISNPRAVLETTLRNYSCLTVGDTICLHYNNKRYYIDIIDAKPQVSQRAVFWLGCSHAAVADHQQCCSAVAWC